LHVPEGVEITRQIFWNVYGGEGLNTTQLLLYAAVVTAIGLFVAGLYRSGFMTRRKMWKLGQGPAVSYTDPPSARFGFTLAEVFSHRKLLREPYPGIFHLGVFYGFLALLITTTIVALQADVFWPLFDWYFFKDRFYLGLSLFADVFGIIAIAGVLMALARRHVIKPAWLDEKGEDKPILWLILFILVTGFVVEGLRIQATEADPSSPMHPYIWFSPGGRLVAFLFAGMGQASLRTAHAVLWWVHVMGAMAFIVLLAGTKLSHIFMTPTSIYLKPDAQTPLLRPMPPEMFEKAEIFGVHKAEEYSWKDLFETEACMRCGRCVEVCPAFNTDKPLRPRDVIRDLRAHLEQKAKFVIDEQGGYKPVPDEAYTGPALIGDTLEKDTIWSCTTCKACVEVCPAYIRQFPKLIELRRYLVMMESSFPGEVQELFKGMENNSNPWSIGAHTRADWAKGQDIPLMSEKGGAEYLFYVGCAGSFDTLNRKVALALARIFRAADLDFAILGTEEGCCGDSVRKIGNEYVYQALATANIETFKTYNVSRIITLCPHGYNTLKHDYRELGGHYEVFHYTEVLERLIREGKIKLKTAIPDLGAVAYHDSCYLGRYNQIYDQPRDILKALSAGPMVEMASNRDKSFCCGAGGGRMWMEEHIGSRINHRRTKEVEAAGARTVCTACPFCYTMLSDGIKELNLSEKLRAVDIAQLVARAAGLDENPLGAGEPETAKR